MSKRPATDYDDVPLPKRALMAKAAQRQQKVQEPGSASASPAATPSKAASSGTPVAGTPLSRKEEMKRQARRSSSGSVASAAPDKQGSSASAPSGAGAREGYAGPAGYLLTVSSPASVAEMDAQILKVQNHQLALKAHRLQQELKSREKKTADVERRLRRNQQGVDMLLRYWKQFVTEAEAALSGVSSSSQDGVWSAAFRSSLEEPSEEVEVRLAAQCKAASQLVGKLASLQDSRSAGSVQDKALASARAELSKVSAEFDKVQMQHTRDEEKHHHLQSEIDSLNFDLDKSKNEAMRLGDKLSAVLVKLEDAQREITQLTERLESRQDASASISNGPSQGGAPDASTNVTPGEAAKLREELEELKVVSEHRLEELRRLRDDYQQLQTEFDKTRPQAGTAPYANQDEVDKLGQEREYFREQHAVLQKRLADKTAEMSQLRMEFQRVVDDLHRAKAEFEDHMKKELQTMTTKLQALTADRDRLQRDLDLAKHSLQQATKTGGGADAEARNLIETLQANNKSLNELTARLQQQLASMSANTDSMSADEQMAKLQADLRAQQEETAVLLEEITTTGKAFEDISAQNGRLQEKLKEKERLEVDVVKDRLRFEQIRLQNQRRLTDLESRMQVARDESMKEIESLRSTVKKLKAELETKSHQLQEANTELANAQDGSQTAQSGQANGGESAARSYDDIKSGWQAKQLAEEIKALQDIIKDKNEAIQKATDSLQRSKERMATYKQRLQRVESLEAQGEIGAALEAEIEELQRKLRCTVCNSHEKDTVMLKCYHVFCHDCIETRYNSRQRKCPQCSQPFGREDYHRIFLL